MVLELLTELAGLLALTFGVGYTFEDKSDVGLAFC